LVIECIAVPWGAASHNVAEYRSLALPRGERQTNLIKSLAESLGNSCSIEFQGISAACPKQKFEPLEHSVYVGRRFLGRYKRIGKNKFSAFDADDRLLGRFKKLANAQKAFDRLAAEGEQ
jgi:hypothetical protein